MRNQLPRPGSRPPFKLDGLQSGINGQAVWLRRRGAVPPWRKNFQLLLDDRKRPIEVRVAELVIVLDVASVRVLVGGVLGVTV